MYKVIPLYLPRIKIIKIKWNQTTRSKNIHRNRILVFNSFFPPPSSSASLTSSISLLYSSALPSLSYSPTPPSSDVVLGTLPLTLYRSKPAPPDTGATSTIEAHRRDEFFCHPPRKCTSISPPLGYTYIYIFPLYLFPPFPSSVV